MKLGIIGNGESARSFAGASHHAPGVELVAIAGRSVDRVLPLTEKFGGQAMTIDQLYTANVDCVAISTPPGLHEEHALPFIKRGIAVLIEKPMALSIDACQRINEAASRSGAKVMVTQTHRYNAYGRTARQIVTDGRFGKVLDIYAYIGMDYFGPKRVGWQLETTLSGGGVTFNPFIHAVDFARYVSGSEVKSFTGTIGYHKAGYDIDSDVRCHMTFENGATGFVHVDGMGHKPGHEVDVLMEHAAMIIRPSDKRIEIRIKGRVAEVYGFGENGLTTPAGIYGHCGYIGHLTEMRDVLAGQADLTSDGISGAVNVMIAQQLLAENPQPAVPAAVAVTA